MDELVKKVYWLHPKEEGTPMAHMLEVELQRSGINASVRHFSNFEQLETAFHDNPPHLVLSHLGADRDENHTIVKKDVTSKPIEIETTQGKPGLKAISLAYSNHVPVFIVSGHPKIRMGFDLFKVHLVENGATAVFDGARDTEQMIQAIKDVLTRG